jgi:stage II sporulation protein D
VTLALRRRAGATGGLALVVGLLAPASADAGAPDAPRAAPFEVAGPLVVEPTEGGIVALGRTRLFGTLELRRDGERVRPIVELDLETYLLGIAEMPASWHEEALQAQAIAARTYAWRSIERGTFEGFDICATTACQVFRGAELVADGGVGLRWAEAVAATAGQALLDGDGEPILARYFSTSGGRTFANEEAFPSSGPFPYLVSIDDPDDAVSPYHRWTVRFTREEFDAIAARGDNLGRVTPIASATRVGDVEDPRASIRFTGRNGRVVEVRAIALRDFLSTYAPREFPDRFPGPREDGERRLPTTVPTTRFEIEVTADEVVLRGRGWGHGVGLGQYGALGRAERGQTHREILAAYYGGIEPVVADGLPGRVRVGLDRFGEVRELRAEAPTRIVAGGVEVVGATLGTWLVGPSGAGFVLEPPPGEGAELVVGATRAVLGVERLPGRPVDLEVELSKPVLLTLEVTDESGAVVVEEPLGLAESGTRTARWRRVDDSGVPVAPGRYRVRLVGVDALGASDGTATTVVVTEPPPPPPPVASDDRPVSRALGAAPIAALVLVLVAAVAVALAGRRRGDRERGA